MEQAFDNFADLIQYFEDEQERLRKCINDAAAEWDFTEAKRLAKAYRYVQEKLNVLRSLNDRNYDQRMQLLRHLDLLKRISGDHADSPRYTAFLQQEIDETNKVLSELPGPSSFPIDTQYVDDALFDLVEGTITRFKLHLSKTQGLTLDFTCNDKILVITLTYNKGALSSYVKKRIRGIGFHKIDGRRAFVRTLYVGHFQDAQSVKQFLAVLVFDVLSRYELDNPAALEFIKAP